MSFTYKCDFVPVNPKDKQKNCGSCKNWIDGRCKFEDAWKRV